MSASDIATPADRIPIHPPTLSRPSIEVSTVVNPPVPMASASSPDDDPTGVRALLSALPEPDPMPDHLVERINASLAAAQSQRAASSSLTSLTPLVASTRRRPGRVLLALAGTAAAVALVAVVGSTLFRSIQPAGTSSSVAAAVPSAAREVGGGASPRALDKSAAGSTSTPPLIQVRRSETWYTQADFATQARTLRSAAFDAQKSMAALSAGVGPVGTAAGLTDCVRAIGAGGAQVVQADLAFYEGAPAVIIVATTDGIPMAYAVGRECSLADAAVLRPGTPLP
jgi:hypothetical protein